MTVTNNKINQSWVNEAESVEELEKWYLDEAKEGTFGDKGDYANKVEKFSDPLEEKKALKVTIGNNNETIETRFKALIDYFGISEDK